MLNLYPASAHAAHDAPPAMYPPAIDTAVKAIREACVGLGTDEAALIGVLSNLNVEDRRLVALRYKDLYGKALKDEMKSEVGGNFGYLMQLITVPLPEAEAMILRMATKGAGTTEKMLYPILMGRTNAELAILKKTYFNTYNEDLSVLLHSEVGGDLRKVFLAAVQGQVVPFNPAFHTKAKAEEDAAKLYKAGEGKWGTDEESFINVLVSSPPEHLANVNAEYVKKHDHTIAKAIEKEFGGDSKRALVFHVRWLVDPIEFIAEHFESTMKGFGTDEFGLSAAVVRYQSILPAVAMAYKKIYGKSLRDRIHGETSGDYRRLLEGLLDAPQSATSA